MLFGVRDGQGAQGRRPFGKDHQLREAPGTSAARAMPPGAVPLRHCFDLRDQTADLRIEALGHADTSVRVAGHRRKKTPPPLPGGRARVFSPAGEQPARTRKHPCGRHPVDFARFHLFEAPLYDPGPSGLHFVGGALGFAGLLFLGAHFAFMNAFFSHPEMWQTKGQTAPPEVFFAFF
jgi:hypothetical protein